MSIQNQVNNSSEKQSSPAILGVLAGVLVSTLLQPLEVIKMGTIIGPSNNQSIITQMKNQNFLVQSLTITKYLFKTEGIKGFYRGLFPAITRGGLGSGVYFHTLSKLDEISSKYQGTSETCHICHFLSSALARTISTIIINPFSVVGSRFEIPGFNQYNNMLHGLVQLYKAEGISGYTRGVIPTIMKEFPFAGIYLLIYRPIKKYLDDESDLHYAKIAMISGMIAGFFATMSSHPFEIIRARMQVNRIINTSENKCDGIIDGFKNIYQSEGIIGFARGLTPRLVKKPMVNTLTFVMFEVFHFNFNSAKW